MSWVILASERDPLAETLVMVLSNGNHVVEILADFAIEGTVVTLSGLHIYGSGANTIGPARPGRAARDGFMGETGAGP